jgi:hypothetical protein
VADFAKHFGKSPDKLGPDYLRVYQAYLLDDPKLSVAAVVCYVAALRFFFIRTLKRGRDSKKICQLRSQGEFVGRLPARLSTRRPRLFYISARRFVSGSRHTRKERNNSGKAGATFPHRTVTRAISPDLGKCALLANFAVKY